MRYLLFLSLILSACKTPQLDRAIYQSEDLKIEQVGKNSFVHISYLQTQTFGKVGCNGMIVRSGKEAIIFDTPADDKTSEELINWVQSELKCQVKAIIPTHFHVDCLGGLKTFHENGVSSYANQLTIDLAKADNNILPQEGFNQTIEFELGKDKVLCSFLGEGHTKDNVVAYFPKDKVLFGGCLIKSLKAGKGNLADANIEEWSNTVKKVKQTFPEIEKVIPGHGKSGGTDLLDYTIEMFEND